MDFFKLWKVLAICVWKLLLHHFSMYILKYWCLLKKHIMHLLLFSTGVFTQDLAMFGNSWAEEDPQLGRCPVVPSLYPSPCAMQDPRVLLVLHTNTHTHILYILVPHQPKPHLPWYTCWIRTLVLHCRKWRKFVPPYWRNCSSLAMSLSVHIHTWPVAPMTSACKYWHYTELLRLLHLLESYKLASQTHWHYFPRCYPKDIYAVDVVALYNSCVCIIVSHGAGLVPMVMLCARFSQSMPDHVPMLDIRCITGDHTFLFAVGYVINA